MGEEEMDAADLYWHSLWVAGLKEEFDEDDECVEPSSSSTARRPPAPQDDPPAPRVPQAKGQVKYGRDTSKRPRGGKNRYSWAMAKPFNH